MSRDVPKKKKKNQHWHTARRLQEHHLWLHIHSNKRVCVYLLVPVMKGNYVIFIYVYTCNSSSVQINDKGVWSFILLVCIYVC